MAEVGAPASCPHILGHGSQSHHLVPICLATKGLGKHKLSCALEAIHTWICQNCMFP